MSGERKKQTQKQAVVLLPFHILLALPMLQVMSGLRHGDGELVRSCSSLLSHALLDELHEQNDQRMNKSL